MRMQAHRRRLVVSSSSADQADRLGPWERQRLARTARTPRFIRIGVLLTVMAVRPRWAPLLAGTVFTVLGFADRQAIFLIIPGLLCLWQALLTPGDTDADRERRSQLKRELAAYSTPAQRYDLVAALGRYPDGTTHEIRDILAAPVDSHPYRYSGR
jgi:hypothetical protein